MADRAAAPGAGSGRGSSAPGAAPPPQPAGGHVLLVLIASSPAMLDELITALLDIGVSGSTVIESKGMGAIIRDEMPIFAGLASMIPAHTGSRIMLSAITREQADAVFAYLETEFKPAKRPVAFTTPIERLLKATREK